MSLERKIILGTALILLIPFSLAADTSLDSEIVQSCDSEYEPVISMANPASNYNNPGTPDMYDYNLCVRGIEESSFSTYCDESTGFYVSSKNRTAHFSEQNSYYWSVCTGRMSTRITSGPKTENETALFSVSDKHNGHVAEPDVFDYNVYGQYKPPRNITLELEFNLSSSDKVYFDNEEVNGEQEFAPPAAFPYMISEYDTEPIVSGLIATSFTEASRTFTNSKNRLSITRSGAGEFILPLTGGDLDNINRKETDIMNREFTNALTPSFGFEPITDPNIKVRLNRADIVSDLSSSPGSLRVNVTKTSENEVTIKEVR